VLSAARPSPSRGRHSGELVEADVRPRAALGDEHLGRGSRLLAGQPPVADVAAERCLGCINIGDLSTSTRRLEVNRAPDPESRNALDDRAQAQGVERDVSELSIIVPTFKEVGNVEEVLRRVVDCLDGVDWELIFVDDDSPDGTVEKIRQLAQRDRRVRCVHRIGRRGLSSACIEGMLSSTAPVVAVMDADLQHDERLLRPMLNTLRNENLDLVVASRYAEGGSTGRWDESRTLISRAATRLSRLVLKADLRDPMSGFFMITHDTFLRCIRAGVTGIGFKILLDLFASSPQPLRFKELPYEFRGRFSGESKLDSSVAWEYFLLLLDKLFGRVVPIRFVAFSLVGGFGVLVHLAVLTVLFKGLSMSFLWSQVAATVVAMTSNFLLNNVLTYRDMRLRAWRLIKGWVLFGLVCSVGGLANVGIANYLFEREAFWVLSAVAGILVGAVWNYAVTAFYTWGMTPRA
jgi:dolichol-phosphate mannosyltransferase